MERNILTTIILLKKELAYAIERNHYDLLSPEVLRLSRELDCLMTPLFENQLAHDLTIDYFC